MKNLLFVFFVFAGMITFFTHAMVFAAEVTAFVFWGAVASMIAAMVVIGCWDLGARMSDRVGWLFMVFMAAFCILTTLPLMEGAGSLVKIVFFALYAAVGVMGFIREPSNDEGAPAH